MKWHVIFITSILLGSCSSNKTETGGPVLEAVPSATVEQAPIEPPKPVALDKLQAKLAELGYEGVGMELEGNEVLELLLQAFSDPSAKGRKIKIVYTGAAMAYEGPEEELTIGGTKDVKVILSFIKKKVPLRKKK